MNEPLIVLVRNADGTVRRRFVEPFAAAAPQQRGAAETETPRRIGSGGALRLRPSG